MASERYKYLTVIIILFILYNCLFVNKALHIDDPATVLAAHIVNIDSFWPPPKSASHTFLLGYYYAPILRIFGESEFWFHIFYFPFSILASPTTA